tara:strand:- start:152 stop:421 length:270 start_codon:yes stop_codon:yes gene_type:complete
VPRYTYRCEKCEEVFEIVHSMNTELKKKDECSNECDLIKVPSSVTIIKKAAAPGKNKVGEVVKNSIESFKEDLKIQREGLLNKVYEEND